MRYLTPSEVAQPLAFMLMRSGQTRARISETTVRLVSGRPRQLRDAFVVALASELQEYGWILARLDQGGFGVVATRTLEAARPVTARRFLTPSDMQGLRRGVLNPVWEAELSPEPEEGDNSEEDGNAG